MRLDAIAIGTTMARAAEEAAAAEAAGYDGYTVAELNHDPFLALAQAAAHTTHLRLGTSIAGAFTRSPTTLAQLGWDLHAYSGGRFALGLGAQVRAHVNQRFSLPWSAPAPRMVELVQAIRTVWSAWATGGPLLFQGDHYQLSLMPPFFRPEPQPHGVPDILVAAVGERLTEAAGAVADGFIAHSFTTPEYFRERTLPALRRGLSTRDRDTDAMTVVAPVFVVSGRSEEEMALATARTRHQIAFYASEATYRAVLEHHGWGGAQDDLAALLAAGRMDEMGSVVDDEMLAAFAVVAEPEDIAAGLHERFGGLVDRVSLYTPYEADPALWHPVAHELGARAAVS